MKLTKRNYYSRKANQEYMSVSQFKRFMECEAATMAELTGKWVRKKSVSLLIGSFVDAYFDGTLSKFTAENPEIYTKSGELKSEYKHAQYIISRIETDPIFAKYMAGKKQVIVTGEIDGIPWKGKIDSYHTGKAIVDLKVMKDFAPVYKAEMGRLNFVEAWGYDIQGAVYQALEGNHLPFYIAAVTKEPEPDKAVIHIPQDVMDSAMEVIKANMHRFYDLKRGLGEPIRCEKCDYCKHTKMLDHVTELEELDNG